MTSVTAGQSQEMLNGNGVPSSRRCRCFKRRHCFLAVLLTAAVFFLCNTNMKTMMPDLTYKLWGTNLTKKLITPTGKQGLVSGGTGQSPTERTAVSVPQSDGWMSLIPSAPQTTGRTKEPQTELHAQPHGLSHVPYKSPGPYFVEYPSEYHFVINEPQKCEKEEPFVVLVVPVAPHNRDHRNIIRSTWGNQSQVLDRKVLLFFLLGLKDGAAAPELQQQLQLESRQHRDLIQSDFVDCYKNLTIKTMVMLEWLDSYCSSASYAMKIDSDMSLNVHNLIIMLLKAPKSNYMTGLVAHGAPVLRDPSSKWYLPETVYPQSQYPPYALGLGYILSLDLPKKLIMASRHVKAVYIEDVYLGQCMEHLHLRPTLPPNINQFQIHPSTYNRCAFSKVIVTATAPGTDRIKLWRDFIAPGPDC